MFSLPITVDDKEFQDTMLALEKRNMKIRPLLDRWNVWMIRSITMNFIQEGRPKKWAVLAKTTIAGRRKQSSRILQDTGRLRMSATVRSAPGNITRFSRDSLIMGSSLKQAAWLQYGTAPYTIRPKRKKVLRFKVAPNVYKFAKIVYHPGLVPRPFIGIQEEDEVELTRLAAEFSLEV